MCACIARCNSFRTRVNSTKQSNGQGYISNTLRMKDWWASWTSMTFLAAYPTLSPWAAYLLWWDTSWTRRTRHVPGTYGFNSDNSDIGFLPKLEETLGFCRKGGFWLELSLCLDILRPIHPSRMLLMMAFRQIKPMKNSICVWHLITGMIWISISLYYLTVTVLYLAIPCPV